MTLLSPVSMKVQIATAESGPQYKRFGKLASRSKQTEHSTQREQVTAKIMISPTQLSRLFLQTCPLASFFSLLTHFRVH